MPNIWVMVRRRDAIDTMSAEELREHIRKRGKRGPSDMLLRRFAHRVLFEALTEVVPRRVGRARAAYPREDEGRYVDALSHLLWRRGVGRPPGARGDRRRRMIELVQQTCFPIPKKHGALNKSYERIAKQLDKEDMADQWRYGAELNLKMAVNAIRQCRQEMTGGLALWRWLLGAPGAVALRRLALDLYWLATPGARDDAVRRLVAEPPRSKRRQ